MNVNIIWDTFLNNIKSELTPLSFETWFQETKLYEYKDGICKIIVPMSIYKKHLNNKYKDIIINNLNNITNDNVSIEFYTEDEIKEFDNNISNDVVGEDINSSVDNNFNTFNNYQHHTNLIKKYTFDSFIVGNTNKFAQRAALEVAKMPGKLYNPLFIYGNSGLGKTHLMNAIGNYITENSDLKVLYVNSDEFTSDFIGINKKDDNEQNFDKKDYFNNKYRNVDVLIVDDIQFFQSAPKSQDQFFKIFEVLHRNNKQIILSSDRSPQDLKKLEDRLVTRFCWGLTVDIYPPDFELRVEILKKKIKGEALNKEIPDDVIEYIASNIGNNVRNLEGALNRLIAYSTFSGGTEINLDVAVEALKDDINKGYSESTNIDKIQRIVAEHYQITVEDMKSKKRSANLAIPRQIAMYLCRTMTDESFPKIGIDFGGKDHSTVIHSVEKIEKELKTNKELANTIEKIKQEIG